LFGRSLNYILDKIFFVNPPFVALENSDAMTRSLPSADIVEVGTTIQFDANAIHNVGLIASADGTPAVQLVGDAESFTFTDFTGTVTGPIPWTSNAQNFIGDAAPALFGANTLSCAIPWAFGTGNYFWQDGVRSLAFEFQRLSGDAVVTNTVTGEYGAFYGSGDLVSVPTNIAEIRALPIQLIDGVGRTTILKTLPAGDVVMYFYLPQIGYAVESIFNDEQGSLYVTSDFATQVVAMEDAAGVPLNYIEYRLDIGGIGFLENQTYSIKIIAF